MKNEKIKAISEKLQQLSEEQIDEIRQAIDKITEDIPMTPREKLFMRVQKTISGISDISIENEHGVVEGIGANLIYDEHNDENVSLCYMLDTDQFELMQNYETVLVITKNSPILEALKELFFQISDSVN